MALKPCRECRKKVSTEAVTCPSCGVPNPTKPWKANVEYRKSLTSSSSSSKKTTSSKDTSLKRFMDCNLDLKTAFWGYGFFGSILVGVVCEILAEAFSPFFIVVFILVMIGILNRLWRCAITYKKQMAQKKESELWGILTQAYCVLAAIGLINFIQNFL